LRCSPGEDLEEELLIELWRFLLHGGGKHFFRHGVEEPQVSAGVIGEGLPEGIGHELRGAGFHQGVLEVVEEVIPGKGFEV
jgi:hypothetical protein